MNKKQILAGIAVSVYGVSMYIMGIVVGMYVQEVKDLTSATNRLEEENKKLDNLVRLAG